MSWLINFQPKAVLLTEACDVTSQQCSSIWTCRRSLWRVKVPVRFLLMQKAILNSVKKMWQTLLRMIMHLSFELFLLLQLLINVSVQKQSSIGIIPILLQPRLHLKMEPPGNILGRAFWNKYHKIICNKGWLHLKGIINTMKKNRASLPIFKLPMLL